MPKKKQTQKTETKRAAYYVAEHGKDGDDWAEEYGMLKGPDGFSCCLTEPEDREWFRDLSDVVERLNAQHATLQRVTQAFIRCNNDLVDTGQAIESALQLAGLPDTTRELLEAILCRVSGARANLQTALYFDEEVKP